MAQVRLDAGKLRHSVAILARNSIPDALGNVEGAYVNAFGGNIRAFVEYLRGKELFAAQQQESRAEVRISIRWRAGITPQMRVQWVDGGSTHLFLIEDIIMVKGQHVYLELLCKELRESAS